MRLHLLASSLLLLISSFAQVDLKDHFYLRIGYNTLLTQEITYLPNQLPSYAIGYDPITDEKVDSVAMIQFQDLEEGHKDTRKYRRSWSLSLGYSKYLSSSKLWKVNADIGISGLGIEGQRHDSFLFDDQFDASMKEPSVESGYTVDPYYVQLYSLNTKASLHYVFSKKYEQTIGIGFHLYHVFYSKYLINTVAPQDNKDYHVELQDRSWQESYFVLLPMLRYDGLIFNNETINLRVFAEATIGRNFSKSIRYDKSPKALESTLLNFGIHFGLNN